MRRIFALLTATVLVASACGRDASAVSAVSKSAVSSTATSPTTELSDSTVTTTVPDSTTTTAAPVEVVLPTGRDAIAAVDGAPHVLWFWGAH